MIKNTVADTKYRYLSSNKPKLELHKMAPGIADIIGNKQIRLMSFILQNIGMYDFTYKPYHE